MPGSGTAGQFGTWPAAASQSTTAADAGGGEGAYGRETQGSAEALMGNSDKTAEQVGDVA